MVSNTDLVVLDAINKMNRGGVTRTNYRKPPRQVEVAERLLRDYPERWNNRVSMRVIVSRSVRRLLEEGLIREEKRRYLMTESGNYLLSSRSARDRGMKFNYESVAVPVHLSASFAISASTSPLIQERVGGYVKDLASKLLEDLEAAGELEKGELDLKVSIQKEK